MPSAAGHAEPCYAVTVTSTALDGALRDHASDLLESWSARFERSALRFRRDATATAYAQQAANLIEALTMAMSEGLEALRPGSDLTRELERACAFLGSQFSGTSSSGFDVAAFLLALRDAVLEYAGEHDAPRVREIFEWLGIVALDAFASGGLQSLRERTTEELEAGTPIVELLPKVPVVIFVGGPTAATMDALLSRGLMLSIGTSSACLLLDVTGLCESSLRQFPKTFAAFVAREVPASIELLLVGAPHSVCMLCREALGLQGRKLTDVERIDAAITYALGRNGYAIVHRD
jgi:hypothetical protein